MVCDVAWRSETHPFKVVLGHIVENTIQTIVSVAEGWFLYIYAPYAAMQFS